jgi:hypothetical protein
MHRSTDADCTWLCYYLLTTVHNFLGLNNVATGLSARCPHSPNIYTIPLTQHCQPLLLALTPLLTLVAITVSTKQLSPARHADGHDSCHSAAHEPGHLGHHLHWDVTPHAGTRPRHSSSSSSSWAGACRGR